jgi:hypothetical protein
MRVSAYAVAISVGFVAGNACLLDLDHQLACGDGYVDGEAGEECDPADPESFKNACAEVRPAGTGACDPEACTIIDTLEQCAYCGDSIIDAVAGEECEGDQIGAKCPTFGEVGCVACKFDFSKCDKCGNGVLDPEEGEECDPAADGGDIAVPRPCAGAAIGTPQEIAPLKSPYQDQPYSSGQAVGCLDDCKYDRTECGYCNNGKLESEGALVSLPTQPTTMSRPEKCDGVNFDPDKLAQEYPCGEAAIGNVECSDNCLEFVRRDVGPECCLPKGEDCPLDGTFPRCCHEFAQPDVEQHCSDPFAPPDQPPDPEGGKKCN